MGLPKKPWLVVVASVAEGSGVNPVFREMGEPVRFKCHTGSVKEK